MVTSPVAKSRGSTGRGARKGRPCEPHWAGGGPGPQCEGEGLDPAPLGHMRIQARLRGEW